MKKYLLFLVILLILLLAGCAKQLQVVHSNCNELYVYDDNGYMGEINIPYENLSEPGVYKQILRLCKTVKKAIEDNSNLNEVNILVTTGHTERVHNIKCHKFSIRDKAGSLRGTFSVNKKRLKNKENINWDKVALVTISSIYNEEGG